MMVTLCPFILSILGSDDGNPLPVYIVIMGSDNGNPLPVYLVITGFI